MGNERDTVACPCGNRTGRMHLEASTDLEPDVVAAWKEALICALPSIKIWSACEGASNRVARR